MRRIHARAGTFACAETPQRESRRSIDARAVLELRPLTSARRATNQSRPPVARLIEEHRLGSVIKKRRKKMRKHKKRKLLRRARHKRKR